MKTNDFLLKLSRIMAIAWCKINILEQQNKKWLLFHGEGIKLQVLFQLLLYLKLIVLFKILMITSINKLLICTGVEQLLDISLRNMRICFGQWRWYKVLIFFNILWFSIYCAHFKQNIVHFIGKVHWRRMALIIWISHFVDTK